MLTSMPIRCVHLSDRYYYSRDDLNHGKCMKQVVLTVPNHPLGPLNLYAMKLHTSEMAQRKMTDRRKEKRQKTVT